MPDKFESGSHNAIGLAGLNAALEYLERETVARRREHDHELAAAFIEGCRNVEGLTIYGPTDPLERVAVFSVRLEGLEPGELAALLETEFGILTRPGIHCAPLAHRTIGTDSLGGTTRLSFGAYNTLPDVRRCIDALAKLAAIDAPA
ncbi:MAG: aminotransferase class V-fold PLP-dependent enzyme [Planctomycetes bacterium]|nr:aminotransferase class V-fold PLP-dependent enzyme [Planctomycetota bacterium]